MLRRTLRKIIPAYAILPLALTGLMNLTAYSGAKLFQLIFGMDNAIDMTTKWDLLFPFTPVWILVYIGTFVFWTYQYTTVARESPEAAYRLSTADFCAKIICMVFFILMPTTNVRPEVTGTGFIPFVMRFIYWIDTPSNLFPSIHCFVAWLGTRQMFEAKKIRRRVLTSVLCVIGSLLVFASTLFTKQHVIVDVFSGVAVAEIGFVIAKYTKLPSVLGRLNERFMRTSLCRFL